MVVRARFSIVILVVALAAGEAVAQTPSRAQLLAAAKGAAAYLASQEIRAGATSSWPISDSRGFRATGVSIGAAGIGTFYLELHRASGDPDYLAIARRAAAFVDQSYSRGNYGGADWLDGAASGGTFFLRLYRFTGEQQYLDAAQRAGSFLVSSAVADSGGYFWRTNDNRRFVGLPHGAAGVGSFLLDLYSELPNPVYVERAEGALRWARLQTLSLGEGAIGWKRLASDPEVYHLWSGSTGVIPFLVQLLHTTGKPLYRDLLRQTAQGLRLAAKGQAPGLYWSYRPSNGTRTVIYAHGTSSTAEALFQAATELADPALLGTARAGAAWLSSQRLPDGTGGAAWPHFAGTAQFDTGYYSGTASVGQAFLRFFDLDAKPAYLEAAGAAARYLIDIAEHPAAGQLRWINYTNPANSTFGPHTYETGVFNGVAGIGLFLLELHQRLAPPPAPVTLSAPTDLTLTRSGLTAHLAWRDRSQGEEGFRIYRGVDGAPLELLGETEANTESGEDPDLARGHDYRYRVSAFQAGSESPLSAPVSVEVAAYPDPPTGVEAHQDGRSVRVSWLDASPDESGFRIYRVVGQGNEALLAEVAAGVEEFVDATVEPRGRYRYRVSAFLAAAESPPSAFVTVRTVALFTTESSTLSPAQVAALAPCESAPTARVVCLLEQRFHISGEYWNGQQPVAQPIRLRAVADRSVELFFAGADNIEFVYRLLDGCAVPDQPPAFWFFGGGASNQGFELRVVDRLAGVQYTLRNDAGAIPPSLTDLTAFPTCR